jgi:prepilin-type N-terminal cleavage/methylation domain-containing protein
MRRHPNLARPARPGFTLVELLVVIAIIAVLISLTAAAVFRVREQGNVVKNRHNITQMQTSIQAFTSKTGVDYIPSRIILYNDLSSYLLPTATPFEKSSLTYLLAVWPRLGKQAGAPNRAFTADLFPASDPRYSLGWCPDDPGASLKSAYELEGDQCIVFFLGGIQSGRSCQGFGVDKTNPTCINNVKRDPSFMDFPIESLEYKGSPSTTRAATFLSFIDPYGMPYAYFSSRSFGRRYTSKDPQYQAGLDAAYASGPGYARLDCNGLLNNDNTPANLAPYFEPYPAGASQVKFYARDSYQIISAGPDKKFGSCIDQACNPNATIPQVVYYDARSGFPFNGPLVGSFDIGGGNVVAYPGGPMNVPNPPSGADDLTNFRQVQLGIGE